MILFGDILNDVLRAIRAERNLLEQKRAIGKLNQNAQAIALKDSWQLLRRRLEISWTGTPVQLPGDLIGIDLVWDDANQIEYHARNRSAAARPEGAFRYALYPVGDALLQVSDGAFVQDADSFTSEALDASGETVVGEYISVEGDTQLYKITEATGSLFSMSPAFRGEGSVSGKRITVRPPTVMQIELSAPYGSTVPTGTITIHYWKTPDTLRDRDDVVPFPTAEVLTMRTLSVIPEARKDRPVSQAQVDKALSEALSMNPDKPLPRLAKGLNGDAIDFNRDYYYGACDRSIGGSMKVQDICQTRRF